VLYLVSALGGFYMTTQSAMKEPKATKKGIGQLTQRPQVPDAEESLLVEGGTVPTGKAAKKYLRMMIWAGLSIASLGEGSLASGLLSTEENSVTAILLFLAAIIGGAGCLFFFFCFLREISPRPRGPFISTLH
jgi:hypothetical protein